MRIEYKKKFRRYTNKKGCLGLFRHPHSNFVSNNNDKEFILL